MKLHYAIEINTTSDLNIPEIGMVNGSIRYVTDGVDTTGYTFEDGLDVTDTYYTNFLKKDGISPSNQSIDIITGGDYAFLGALNTTVVNYDELHVKMLKTENLYLIGAEYKLYVIIDEVMYSRWVGVISELKFDDKSFTFVGKDKHNVDNETINDSLFGYVDAELKLVVDEKEAFIEDVFIKSINPQNNIVWYDNAGGSPYASLKSEWSDCYVGFADGLNRRVTSHNTNHWIYITGHTSKIKQGMLLKFSGDDNWYTIGDIEQGVWGVNYDDVESTNWTRLLIPTLPKPVTDFTQLYGYQSSNVSTDIKDATKRADDDVLTVSIYDSGFTYTVPNGVDLVMQDGKYVATDSDGNTVLINGSVTGDKLTILDREIVSFKYPNTSRYFSLDKDEANILNTELDVGKLDHLETLGTGVSIPNDLGSNNYFITDANYQHQFILDFGEDIDDWQIGIINSAMVDSTENWAKTQYSTGSSFRLTSISDNTSQPIVPSGYETEFRSSVIDTWQKNNDSFYSIWEVTPYRIVNEEDHGEVPMLDNNQAIVIPNTRVLLNNEVLSRVHVGILDTTVLHFDAKSTDGTNIPAQSVNSEYHISVENGVEDWRKEYLIYNDGDSDFFYPKGKIVDLEPDATPVTTTSKGKVFITMRNRGRTNGDNKAIGIWSQFGIYYDANNDNNPVQFGVNTICAFKKSTLEPDTKLSFKTHNPDNDNYVSTIKELSGSQSTFRTNDAYSVPDRHVWWTGQQIDNEINTFNLVTTLCKQGFVAGLSDRFGDVILREFIQDINDGSMPFTRHDDNIILDKSIKSFQLSPISKCYNEFTIKYHYSNDEYQKEIGIYNVDEDSFPTISDAEYSSIDANDYTVTPFHRYTDSGGVQHCKLTILDWDVKPTPQQRYVRVEFLDGYATGIVWFSTTGTYTFQVSDTDIPSGAWNFDESVTANKCTFATDEDIVWKTFVSGIDDYTTAKELWEKAHASWLINQRIRTAPTDRTELKWCVDLNEFFDNDDIEFPTTYQWHYTNQLVDWTTRQKFQVSYSLPINDETIKLNLMDKIEFNDPIITPNIGADVSVGKGWITGLQVDSKRDLIKLQITFEPEFMSMPLPIPPQCSDIWEQGEGVWDDIIEDGANTNDIIEGCGN